MSSDIAGSAYKTMFESSPEAMLLCTVDGTILAANPAASSMFLRANEDLFNGGRDSLFSERDRVLFEKFVDESSLAEKATGELLLVRGDGSHFMAEVSATLHRADDAQVLTMFVIREISERIQQEPSLSDIEARWRFAIEGAGDGVFDWNVPSDELRLSRRWKEMLGFAENEIGSGLDEWTSRIHPEDLPHVMSAMQSHLDGSTASYTSEHRLRCKDGGWKWVLARGLVIEREAGGGALRLFGTHEDINERKLADIEQLTSRHALEEAQRLAHLGSWEMDYATKKVTWSDELYRIYGLDRASPVPSYEEQEKLFKPESWERVNAAIKQLEATGRPYVLELEIIRFDGSHGWLWVRGELVQDTGGEITGFRGVALDITERKQAQLELIKRKYALDEAQRLAHLGSWEMDSASEVVTWSDELYRIYGLDPASGPRPFPEYEHMFTPESWTRLDAAVKRAAATGESYELELEIVRSDGSHAWVWARGEEVRDTKGTRTGLRGVVLDITKRKRAEAAVATLSYYDPLTGLANRKRLMQLLGTAITSHGERGQFGGLLMLNMDNFRALKDTLGREAGDTLLIEVSTRLQRSVNPGDIVSRYGDDEFVLLLNNVGNSVERATRELLAIAQTILTRLDDTYDLDDTSYYSTCSAGATLFGDNGSPDLELIKQLSIALSDAKQSGRNRVRFFNPEWQAVIEANVRLLNELRDGIPRHEFEMYFQPQLDQVGNIVGAEALVRWNHPHRGLLSPAEFIPVAEDNGQMVRLGDEIMHLCLAQLQCWQEAPGTRHLKLSINITADQFYTDGFADRLEVLIARHHLDVSGIMLEFTESMLLGNVDLARVNIRRLSALGIRFAIDDFGTGYSSLSYLSELPMEQIKIDQSFVGNIGRKGKDAAIILAIIDMAKALDMEVLAEGVETSEQREYLLQNGCQYFQGFLFSRPLPLAEFNALVPRGPITVN